jgi:catechol 2,3-dioxygenase-like lactoylglutathione lyase family enzyme
LTRRQLLALGVAGVVAPLVVGCGQRSATATPDGTATPAVSERSPLGTPIADLATPTIAPAGPIATALPATPRARLPLLTAPRFRLQDLAATNNLSPDGYTWAQGNPIIVDRHERIIALVQRISREGEALIFTNQFVYSNNGGTIWREAIPAIEGVSRASLAYDDENDILHALWRGQDPAQGIGYRRYLIVRDPQGNIIRFQPDPLGAVILDAQHDGALMTYEHPSIIWLPGGEVGNRYGAVLCVWSARNTAPASPGNEVRASLRLLGNDGSDADQAGWIAPVAPATTTIGSPPTVPYSAVLANRAAGQVYPSVNRARAGPSPGAGSGSPGPRPSGAGRSVRRRRRSARWRAPGAIVAMN